MTNRIVDIFSPEKPVSDLYPQRIYRVEVSLFAFHSLPLFILALGDTLRRDGLGYERVADSRGTLPEGDWK
jgi:hypothetical protein